MQAVGFVSYDKGFSDAIRGIAREVKRSACLNLAAAHIKLHQWRQAVSQCDKVGGS